MIEPLPQLCITSLWLSFIIRLAHCQSIDDDVLERLQFIKYIKTPKNFVTVADLITSPYLGYVMDNVTDHKPLNSYLIPDKNHSFSEWYNKDLGLYERIIVCLSSKNVSKRAPKMFAPSAPCEL